MALLDAIEVASGALAPKPNFRPRKKELAAAYFEAREAKSPSGIDRRGGTVTWRGAGGSFCRSGPTGRGACAGCTRGGTSVVGHVSWRVRSLATAVAVVAALVPFAPVARAQVSPPAGTADTWFFAEGNTLPNWFEFIVIINPDPANSISVHVDYQLEEPAGVSQGTRSQDVS